VTLEGDGYAAGQHHWIAFSDNATGVPFDRTDARVALPGYRNVIHKRSTRSGNYLAAMTGRVTKSDHTLHVFSFSIICVTSD
jgi:hypothetical protein